jgi:hypothetical protein
MQPDKASAANAAMIGNRDASETDTLAIHHSETAQSVAPIMVKKSFFGGQAAERPSHRPFPRQAFPR